MNSISNEDVWNEVRLQALTDNTAQGIFNYLKEIENQREIYEKRWIWELLQNALDAAPKDRRIEVRIVINANELILTHNGRPFEPDEVAHLIYHGSTKKETDVGKFGTGFLVTHLLSRKVNVKGIMDDKRKFDFVLNREGSSSEDIANHLEETSEAYKRSLVAVTHNYDYTAEYKYELNDETIRTAEKGIDALAENAPYVLAFNNKLGLIEIILHGQRSIFKLDDATEGITISYKKVKQEQEGKTDIYHELWIAKREEIEIAIKGETKGNGFCQIESIHNIPKIFIAFPLFGTQDLPLPVIVNSRGFEPTEKRDGIFLGEGETEEIKHNKGLLENAADLFVDMISNDKYKWDNLHVLLGLTSPPDEFWLDEEWCIKYVSSLINRTVSLNVLKTENGDIIPLSEGLIPILDCSDGTKVEMLWSLYSRFLAFKDKLPSKELAQEWQNTLHKWRSIGLEYPELELTIDKLAEEIVGSYQDVQGLSAALSDEADVFDTLNDFYNLLLESDKWGLIEGNNILPNQNGILAVGKEQLYRDEGISSIIKEILKNLGKDIRDILLHSKVCDNIRDRLNAKIQADVLKETIELVKQPKNDDESYLKANIALFNWLIHHYQYDEIEGFPLLNSKDDDYIDIKRLDSVKPLGPIETWNEIARDYMNIFPKDYIISSKYYENIPNFDKWEKLKDEGYILLDPIYKEMVSLSKNDIELLLLADETFDGDRGHESASDIEMSKIAFLETKDKGIIDTIRQNKEKAKEFLKFLFNYVLEYDPNWVNNFEINCICDEPHKIFPANWILPLKRRAWLPVHKGGRISGDALNPYNLGLLIEDDEELIDKCMDDKPSRILNILGVRIKELIVDVVIKDDKAGPEKIKAFGLLCKVFPEPSNIIKIAEFAREDPEGYIEDIENRTIRKNIIKHNQRIGMIVEEIIRDIFEKEGFNVKRTPVGMDFTIEYDYIINGSESIIEVIREEKIYYLIEVKATSQDLVKMTLRQGKTARDESEKYVLCVVSIGKEDIDEEEVKQNVKFVTDIGEIISDKVQKVEEHQGEIGEISVPGDIEIEINEGPIRFRIKRSVWESGKSCEEFVEFAKK